MKLQTKTEFKNQVVVYYSKVSRKK